MCNAISAQAGIFTIIWRVALPGCRRIDPDYEAISAIGLSAGVKLIVMAALIVINITAQNIQREISPVCSGRGK
jgi:hypothetical protein